jgi:divalent metal cation (Fe/Co/Zn/Cd) transporter
VPTPALTQADPRERVARLQRFTLAWMAVELIVAVGSGVAAKSPALMAFGGDSAIELLSAWLVLRRFRAGGESEAATARLTAWLLVALTAFIVLGSAVSLCFPGLRPEPSWIGVLLLATAAVIMPGLGRAKRHLAAELGSASLRADAAQSSACAYLSWIALAGLLLNAWLGWAWADSVAALGLLPFVVREAREAFQGNVCGCGGVGC